MAPSKLISTSVGFQDSKGTVVASGMLMLQLSQTCTVTATGGQVTTEPIYLNLDVNGKITSTAIWFNDELSPSGTIYYGTVYASNKTRMIPGLEKLQYSITGASFDIATALQSGPASPSFAGAVMLTPSGNQTITAGNLTLSNGVFSSKNIEGLRYADQFSGADWGAKVAAAIADLSGPGTVDASNFASAALSGNLSISTSGIELVFPPVNLSAGSNQIIVSAGTHNVRFRGRQPYGSNAGGASSKGAYITYTGTGTAVQVGDTGDTTDTYGFTLEDVTVDITGAGSSAIGIQLNRCINYTLNRPRIIGLSSANSQKMVDLEGKSNFTGGDIRSAYLSNGNNSIFFGKNANGTYIFGGQFPTIGTSTIINFDGGGVNCDGNKVFGGDYENASIAFKFDFATNNQLFGPRIEGTTTSINATANSSKNFAAFTGPAMSTVSNSGTRNSFFNPDELVLSPTLVNLRNLADVPTNLNMAAGSASDQNVNINFIDKTGAIIHTVFKDTANDLKIQKATHAINRFWVNGNNTFIASESTAAVNINIQADANTGTGGLAVWSGGSSSFKNWGVDGAGIESAITVNGGQWIHGNASENLTLSTSGTTTDTVANLLPANSIIEAVCARITTTITTATDWKLGDSVQAARFTAAIATLTSGTTTVGLNQADPTVASANLGPVQTSAAKVRVTTTGTPGAGAIRITVFYRQFVPPTS